MGTKIPTRSRKIVEERERERCLRCGSPARGKHWHHRRTRAVVDDHQHCPCNGVLLCRTCHEWVHANPFEARRFGFIVSRHTNEPGVIPVQSAWGWRQMGCDGNAAAIHYKEQEQEDDTNENAAAGGTVAALQRRGDLEVDRLGGVERGGAQQS